MILPAMRGAHPEIELIRPLVGRHGEILTPAALDFLARLADRFTPELGQLLTARQQRQHVLTTQR